MRGIIIGIGTIGVLLAIVYIYCYIKDIITFLKFKKTGKEIIIGQNISDTINPTRRFSKAIIIEKGDKKPYSKQEYIFHYIALISVIMLILPYTPLGSEEIGSVIQKKNFTGYYQGILTSESDKDYSVTVRIKVEGEVVRAEDIYLGNGNHLEIYPRSIRYWGDGDDLEFERSDIQGKYGDDYYLKLLNTKTDKEIIDFINYKITQENTEYKKMISIVREEFSNEFITKEDYKSELEKLRIKYDIEEGDYYFVD